MRRLLLTTAVLAATGAAQASDLPVPADAPAWFIRTHAIIGLSHSAGSFSTEPSGALDTGQTSYDPQENFGIGVGLGYRTTLGGFPVRAVIDGSLNIRHDTDVGAEFAGGGDLSYDANIRISEIRASLLGDIWHFGLGTVYAGAGVGVARLDTEVDAKPTLGHTDNTEYRISPSAEIGVVLDGIFRKVSPEISYRFRWFGDTESERFADGAQLRYKDLFIHDLRVGFTVPLTGWGDTSGESYRTLTAAAPVATNWTGFHIGAAAGYAFSNDITATPLVTETGVAYSGTEETGIDADGFTGALDTGVDWQWKWLVVGLGGEAGVLNLQGSADDGSSADSEVHTSVDSDWYLAATGRVGLAFDRLLVYAKGGAVFLDGGGRSVDDCTAAPCTPTTLDASDDDVLFGWTAGAGVEYRFRDHWTAGLEYRMFDIAYDEAQPEDEPSAGEPVFQSIDFGKVHALRGSISYRW